MHNERQVAASRLNQFQNEGDVWEGEIKRLNSYIQWSALAQRIGIESAITAATIGAAGFIGRAIAARWAGSIGAAAVRSEKLVKLARVGGYTAVETSVVGVRTGLLAGEALAGMMGRLAAGLLQQGGRLACGDASWRGLGAALLLSIFGRPGPARASFSGIGALSSGSIVSYQGLAVGVTALSKGYQDFHRAAQTRDREFLAMIEEARSQGRNLQEEITGRANDIAASVHRYALENERQVGLEAARRARRADYSAAIPFLARHFSSIEHDLRQLCMNAAEVQAKYDLWTAVINVYNNLERASRGATRMISGR